MGMCLETETQIKNLNNKCQMLEGAFISLNERMKKLEKKSSSLLKASIKEIRSSVAIITLHLAIDNSESNDDIVFSYTLGNVNPTIIKEITDDLLYQPVLCDESPTATKDIFLLSKSVSLESYVWSKISKSCPKTPLSNNNRVLNQTMNISESPPAHNFVYSSMSERDSNGRLPSIITRGIRPGEDIGVFQVGNIHHNASDIVQNPSNGIAICHDGSGICINEMSLRSAKNESQTGNCNFHLPEIHSVMSPSTTPRC
jgi:hypothetical protein